MILVQHGRGGWVNSRTTLAKAMTMAIAGVVVMLVIAGCSKTKPAPVGDANPNANQLDENTTGGTRTVISKNGSTAQSGEAVRSATFISATTITPSMIRMAPC